MAYGSAGEVDAQLEVAKELGYLKEDEYVVLAAQLEEVMRMLNVVIRKLYN